jgi:fatty-acyl-CoA synthase
MSRFVDTLIASATSADGTSRGIVTGEPHEPRKQSWAEIHEQARRVAGGLVGCGLRPGGAVGVLAAAPALIAPTVQAVWLAAGSVTMLHQPTPRTDLAEWAADTVRVLRMIGSELVLLGDPFDQLAPVLEQNDIRYLLISELLTHEPLDEVRPTSEDDLALMQLTSGSTAEPKAVKITHGNLISNITAMVQTAEVTPEHDLMMSWLPTFHDMGMVGFLTTPMTFGIDLVKITPVEFLSGPLIWPELLSKYRATATAAPNFAYAIVGKRMARVAEDDAYDLSALKIALNGAEPIDEAAVAAFVDAGKRFKLDPGAVFSAYGLAEGTLAVSFAPVGAGLQFDVVEPEPLEAENKAVPLPEGDPRRGDSSEVRSFALLGKPLPGFEVQIVDDEGGVLGDRQVGEIRLRGEAVTPGYLTMDGPLATRDADGWFASGDLGYLVDGQIVICGRRKDVIIMGGRNIYPTDVERAAQSVDGVRAGNAIAVRIDAGTRRERYAVVLESKLAGTDDEKPLAREVTARVTDAVGVRPYAVLVLPPGSLPKTPSGKVKRAATASEYAREISGASA